MLAALRAARLDAGLRLEDVAAAFGRPTSFVSKCETGERRIDPIDLWRFAGLYGRPVTAFLPGVDFRPPPAPGRSADRSAHPGTRTR